MKLKIKKSKCREVVYFGEVITIPKKHQYVAADCSGVVYSYPEKPKQSSTFWHGEVYKRLEGVDVDFGGKDDDWQHSVVHFQLS